MMILKLLPNAKPKFQPGRNGNRKCGRLAVKKDKAGFIGSLRPSQYKRMATHLLSRMMQGSGK